MLNEFQSKSKSLKSGECKKYKRTQIFVQNANRGFDSCTHKASSCIPPFGNPEEGVLIIMNTGLVIWILLKVCVCVAAVSCSSTGARLGGGIPLHFSTPTTSQAPSHYAMHQSMQRPMHSPACPLTQTPV